MAKWLGFSYFAWRNTDASSEEEVQNVKVNIDQFGQVMIAALAAAATKAQARYLLATAATTHARVFPVPVEIGVENKDNTLTLNDATPRQVYVPSSSCRMVTAAVSLLVFLTIFAAILRTICKFGCRRMLFLLLAFIALMTQIIVIDIHQLQQPLPVSKKLNPQDAKPVRAANAASATNTSSLLTQFLLRYSNVTGACSHAHICMRLFITACASLTL
jgi:hypothetical protein